MGKLILKEFKETAKYFLPCWGFCIAVYLLRRLYIFAELYEFHFLDVLFSLFFNLFVICAVFIPLIISVFRFDDSVLIKNEPVYNPLKTIISKVFVSSFWYIFVLFSIYNIYEPTILDNIINDPDYFDNIDHYLFNPFPGGFDIELIDFYAIRTIVDSIYIFFFLIIIFTVFYICVCISHAYCFGSKVLTAAFIYASFHIIIFGYGGIAIPLLHLSDYFSRISELYSGVLSTCVGIIIEIILAVILFFICRKLLEKALLKNSEN